MKHIIEKFNESFLSIIPIVAIVFFLALTPFFNVTKVEMVVFALSSITLIIGMTFFNIGAELSMTPMGDYAGSSLVKTKRLTLILIAAMFMGFLVTIAEPDLIVLANQLASAVDETGFVVAVGIGVSIFLLIALLRIIYNKKLAMLLLLFYMLVFAFTALLCESGKNGLVPLAYDSGGVTTGPITVPFVMAFGVGIANTIGGKNSNENSFGFVGLCSIGPVIVVLLFLLNMNGIINYVLPDYSINAILSEDVMQIICEHATGVMKALLFILAFFVVLNIFIMKLPMKKMFQIIIGLVITLIGLVLFLTSASIGFLPIGYSLGSQIIHTNLNILVIICFVIGMTVVLAEPAIHVLTNQIEEVTGGTVSKRSMLVALSVGVGLAIALSIVRIIYKFSILYYLIPGYFISLSLSLFVPPIYTAIAFDSGGVASGSLTSTFILPLMIGACAAINDTSEITSLAFGVISIVAMIPLISIQLLGFRAVFAKALRDKISMNRILRADDNQIIYFEV